MSITRTSSRIAAFLLSAGLVSCSSPESAAPPRDPHALTRSHEAEPVVVAPIRKAMPLAGEPIEIRFETLSMQNGLTISIDTLGDTDGETIFANDACCGIENSHSFVRDVRIETNGQSVLVKYSAVGWTASHGSGAKLTISYRLPLSGPTIIDAGVPGQIRPLVHAGMFHLVGTTALLLPTGRAENDPVELDIDASKILGDGQFVSSFGLGAELRGVSTERAQVAKALYLGGAIALTVHDSPAGKVGVAHSAMASSVDANELRKDALAIVGAERGFFKDSQPWYLVSVHGGNRLNPQVNVGGGTGLTNSFLMFVRSDLDFSNREQREHFRWVLAHEYFHERNGLTLRVAALRGSEKDDASVYWFSEGVTEFYTMRLLTRAGLQSPARSLDVLNNKLMRYAKNSKRAVSAKRVGSLFWTDADGEQIPYLRGYLAAWFADNAMRSNFEAKRDLDKAMQTLVMRAKSEPDFRVDNAFLTAYLTEGLSADDAGSLRKFIIDGGEAPLDSGDFSPCLEGKQKSIAGRATLQFDFSDAANTDCFRH